jgi:hypothetical protein
MTRTVSTVNNLCSIAHRFTIENLYTRAYNSCRKRWEVEMEDTLESMESALAARERGDRRQFQMDINVPEDY